MADPTAKDISRIMEEQRQTAWEESYLNPENTAEEQARVDKVINHDFQIDYGG